MRTLLLAMLLIPLAGCQSGHWPGASDSFHPHYLQSLFDSGWKFHLGDVPDGQSLAFDDSMWRTVQLPHDWSIEQPFNPKWASGTAYLPGGIGWYRNTFTLPATESGKRTFIRFDGVYENSQVWINGHDLGLRPNGFVSFQYELTDYLHPAGTPNAIAVRVDHSNYADSRFYTGSGIYRDVWLIDTDPVHIDRDRVYVTTPQVSADSATVAIQTVVSNQSNADQTIVLTSMIANSPADNVTQVKSTQRIPAGQSFRFDQQCRIPNPTLWSCDHPNLYALFSSVSVNGLMVDMTLTPFGVRTIQFDPNHGFLLNGKKTLIKGICLHQDAGGFGAAVTEDVFARRLRLLKEMGCNAIRTSHNPPSPLLLDLCDQMGFLVMDEAFDEWARPKKKWIDGRNHGTPGYHGYSDYFNQWAVTDIQSMVQRDRNHPSVILWSIGNEIDYDRDPYWNPFASNYQPGKPNASELPPLAQMLKSAVKELDATRPVTAALATISVSNRTGLADVLDVVGYNYQEDQYTADHAKYPNRIITGSENSHFYQQWNAVLTHPFVGGQFLWTGVDYLGESPGWPIHGSPAGNLDECGFKKPLFYYQQSLWSDKPMVYLAVQPRRTRGGLGGGFGPVPAWTAPAISNRPVNVICYTNCQSVELFLNGRSLGVRNLADSFNHVLTWSVQYQPGTLRAVGSDDRKPVCSDDLNTPGSPAAIRLSTDESTIWATGRSLAFVEADVVDHNGNTIYSADNSVHFDLSGPADISVLDSGDLSSTESFHARQRQAFHGQCLLVLRSRTQGGTIAVRASSAGLADGQLTLQSTDLSPTPSPLMPVPTP